MANEKYKNLLNINSDTYDPVIDFRNKVVDMRRQQTKYNKKRGIELLYTALDAENEVDTIIFGKRWEKYIDDGRLSEEKKKNTNERMAN